jgi:hypothetical protein
MEASKALVFPLGPMPNAIQLHAWKSRFIFCLYKTVRFLSQKGRQEMLLRAPDQLVVDLLLLTSSLKHILRT